MKFLNQVKAEMKNMSLSKFIVVSAIIFFLLVVAVFPLLGYFVEQSYDNYYPYDQEFVIVDGVEYENNNSFTREHTYLINELEWVEQAYSGDALKHATAIADELLEFYEENIPLAAQSTREYDYRANLLYTARQNIIDLYILAQPDLSDAALNEGANHFGYSEYLEGNSNNGGVMYGNAYYEYESSVVVDDSDNGAEVVPLTEEEKLEISAELQEELTRFNELMQTDDYNIYVDIKREEFNESIENSIERIEQLEKDVIENPAQEENISQEIKNLQENIEMINEINLPQLDFRVANGIIDGDGSWQDSVLNEIQNLHWRISNAEDIQTEQEFEESMWMTEQYGTYQDYVKAMEIEKQKYVTDLFVAESSLVTNEPDMSFVNDGARNVFYTNFFPTGTMLVTIFAILVGGWCLASEFQNGTVRLMMIRPRTRLKILFSRYLAGIGIVFMLFLAIAIAILVYSGFTGGFSDFFYPNYSATGPVNFFGSMIVDFFTVFVSVVFLYTVAFMISGALRNTAVAIIIPIVMYVGAMVGMNILAYQPAIDILAYTPAPYLMLQDFINPSDYGYVSQFLQKGVPISIELGIAVLVISAAICLALVSYLFKKRDITN